MTDDSSMSPGRRRRSLGAIAVVAGLAGALIVPMPAWAQVPGADLRGDTDRDGVVDVAGPADETGEDSWSRERGIVVLPNLDDDARRCPVKDRHGRPLPLKAMVGCHDGADAVVNGARDAADLAPLRTVPMPGASAAASGTVALVGQGAGFGRLFLRQGTAWRQVKPADRIGAAQLRAGLTLGLEATDIVRDSRRWNGVLTVLLTVHDRTGVSTDTVLARVAPLLTQHHLQRAEQVVVSAVGPTDRDQTRFVAELKTKVAAAGVTAPLRTLPTGDRWAQDFFEPGYVSAPGPGGRPQSIRILIRSAQPARDAGEQLWRRMRGPDVGAIQVPGRAEDWNTLDSMGNLETIPPYQGFPAGRIVMGQWANARSAPSAAMRGMLAAQGYQRPLLLDTSWLYVGHVDEFLQFLPAPTPRGWRLAVSDPAAGLDLLRRLNAAGQGRTRVFSKTGDGVSKVTVAQALANRNLVADNAMAAAKIAANVAVLKRETGLTDAEVVRIPGLYARDDAGAAAAGSRSAFSAAGERKRARAEAVQLSAFIPGAINSLLVAPDRVIAARQWGPVVQGRDVFADAVTAAYSAAGVRADYLDDWAAYHVGQGEVHCGTNTLRNTSTPWWGPPRGP